MPSAALGLDQLCPPKGGNTPLGVSPRVLSTPLEVHLTLAIVGPVVSARGAALTLEAEETWVQRSCRSPEFEAQDRSAWCPLTMT